MSALYAFFSGIATWLMGIVGWIFDFLTLHGIADWFRSPGVVEFVSYFIVALIVFIVGFLISITFIWQERKSLGRIMDRRGTQVGVLGLFQNFADGLKAFIKEIIIPVEVDHRVFDWMPVILIGSSAIMIGLIPLSDEWVLSNLTTGLLLIFAVFSIAPFAILIAGWASNNKYTVIGGMRSAAQLISYEVPLLLSVVGIVLLTGVNGLNLATIVQVQENTIWFIVPQIIGFFVFMVAIVAELERLPFDLPEAEAELVEGWMTEYGGMRFGLILLAEYVRGYAGSALAVILFLGGWSGPFLPPEIWFIIKLFIVFGVFIWVRASVPRVRTDQILNIGWKRLMPLALVNLAVAIGLKLAGWF
jgi:NADH-quinone oxidoreductase subunit H